VSESQSVPVYLWLRGSEASGVEWIRLGWFSKLLSMLPGVLLCSGTRATDGDPAWAHLFSCEPVFFPFLGSHS
jgi:hypothetical protein